MVGVLAENMKAGISATRTDLKFRHTIDYFDAPSGGDPPRVARAALGPFSPTGQL